MNARYRSGVPAAAAGSTRRHRWRRSASRSFTSPGSIEKARLTRSDDRIPELDEPWIEIEIHTARNGFEQPRVGEHARHIDQQLAAPRRLDKRRIGKPHGLIRALL